VVCRCEAPYEVNYLLTMVYEANRHWTITILSTEMKSLASVFAFGLAFAQNVLLAASSVYNTGAETCNAPGQATIFVHEAKLAPKVFIIGMVSHKLCSAPGAYVSQYAPL
jgi:hypothetical protein